MNIVGLTGHLKHGKTSFAETLTEMDPQAIYIESGLVIAEVANAFHEQMPRPPEQNNVAWMNKWLTFLPDILKETVHVDTTYEQLSFTDQEAQENLVMYKKFFTHSESLVKNPDLAEQKITPENKNIYRPILQWLGGYCVSKVSPTIWYDEIFRRVDHASEGGAEMAVLGGIRNPSESDIVRDHGGLVVKIIRPDMPPVDMDDPTERSIDAIVPDVTVFNNGDLEQLKVTAETFMKDLAQNNRKSIYIANQ